MDIEKVKEDLLLSENIVVVPFTNEMLLKIEDLVEKEEPGKSVSDFIAELVESWITLVNIEEDELKQFERDHEILSNAGMKKRVMNFRKLFLSPVDEDVKKSGTRSCRIYDKVYSELLSYLNPVKDEVKFSDVITNIVSLWLNENSDVLYTISSKKIEEMKKELSGYSIENLI